MGSIDGALYELLNLDVYDLLGLEVDAYDTTPCPLAFLNELRWPLQRVLDGSDLAHWNDYVCSGSGVAEQRLREAAAWISQWAGLLANQSIAVNRPSHRGLPQVPFQTKYFGHQVARHHTCTLGEASSWIRPRGRRCQGD